MSTKIPIHISYEVLVCKISISRNRVLIIVTFYRLPNRDINDIQNLCLVIEQIYINFKNAVIWTIGGVNLPHVDWNNHLVLHAPYPREIYNLFMDTLTSGGFTQQFETPTS